jgi:hypothetical protein
MVLGIRLIVAAATLLGACSAAPAPEQAPEQAPGAVETPQVRGAASTTPARPGSAPIDRVTLGRTAVALVDAEAGCAVRIGRMVHPLGIPAPCRLLGRGRSAAAVVEDYGAHGRVAMVIGPPAPATDYNPAMAETPADRCASIGRAIIERDGRVALGEVMRSPAGYCPDIGMDEKFYYGIAHARPFAARVPLS